MSFSEKLTNDAGIQQEVRKAVFDAIEGVAKKNGESVIGDLEKAYENKPEKVGCVNITHTSFCITF